MSQGRRAGLLSAGAATLALALPAAAAGKVTIGEDTRVAASGSAGCVGACTVATLQHPTSALAVPFDGVVVRWRVRGAGPPSQISLRVLRRPVGGGAFSGAGTSAPAAVIAGGERTFDTALPTLAGDLIALNLPGSASVELRTGLLGASWVSWIPQLGDAESPGRAPSDTTPDEALVFNADIEPDCDRDGRGDESQDFDLLNCNPPPCAGRKPTIVGSLGNDNLKGTPGPDVILASIGDDKVAAGAGNDTVCGGKNRDRLAGGAGKDRLFGELGKDVLLGERGRDRLKGQGGKDKCKGGPGRDRGSSCEKARSVERLRPQP
jgi:Ca2+-binding RTX toxin-like protein